MQNIGSWSSRMRVYNKMYTYSWSACPLRLTRNCDTVKNFRLNTLHATHLTCQKILSSRRYGMCFLTTANIWIWWSVFLCLRRCWKTGPETKEI